MMNGERIRQGEPTKRPTRILVTGGAGFIGANLTRMLLKHNYQVTVLDNLSTGFPGYIDGLPLKFFQGDILDTTFVNEIVPAHDAVVHLAAQTGVPGSLADPRQDCQVNVMGTINLLEAIRRVALSNRRSTNGITKFIFASSNAPLGRQSPPATEDKVPLPISPYGASKLAGEAYCQAYHGSWGLGTVALRFANVYGPYSIHKQSVIAKFFKDIMAKGEINIDGDGHQTRDFIYVDDLCRAILLAMTTEVSGEVFQIATGVETSILELADLVQQVTVAKPKVFYKPPRKGDIHRNYSSITKVIKLLKWKPQVSLAEGIRKTWQWFEEWFSDGEKRVRKGGLTK